MGRLSLRRLWVLMATAFVDMVGYALVLPLLPLYADQLGADASVIGVLLGAFAFGQLVTGPLWGRLSDRVGRRPVIVCGQILSAVAFLVFAGANSVWLLLLSRLVQGAGGGTLSANQAYVSDSVVPEQRAQALGWITAATSAGVMVGPAIGSFSVRFGDALPGLIAAGLCVVNVLFAWHWLPESSAAEQRSAPGRRPLRQALSEVVRRPMEPAHALIWVYTGGMMAFMAMSGLMSLYLKDRFGIDKEHIGWFYVVLGLVSVIMRAVILGFLVDLLGEVRVLRLGALSLVVGLAAIPFTGGPLGFMLVMLFIPTGTALLFPSTTSLISRYSRRGETGQTHGVQQAFGGTSRMLAPIWAGTVYRYLSPSIAFWCASAIVAATLLFSLRVRPGEAPKPAPSSPPAPLPMPGEGAPGSFPTAR